MSHRLFGFIPVHLTHRALWLSPSGVKEQSRHISQVTGAALLCLYLFIIQVLFIHAVLLSQQIKLLKTACACLIQLPLSFIFDINKYELLSFNSGLSLTSHLSQSLFVSCLSRSEDEFFICSQTTYEHRFLKSFLSIILQAQTPKHAFFKTHIA